MTTEAYEKRGELIRAPIRTRLGNIVMRWVRPDNANIVVERRPAVPVPAPVVTPDAPEFPKLYEMHESAVAGCCGATYFRAAPPQKEPEPWSDDKIKAAWEKDWKGSHDLYVGYVATYSPGSKDGKYYQTVADQYTLEAYTAKRQYLKRYNVNSIVTTPGPGAGVSISPDPFYGFTLKTPAGWYLRMDRDPVNTKTDEAIEPNEVPTFKVNDNYYCYALAAQPFKDDNKSWCLTGMIEGQHSGYNMMAACKNANIPVGAKVLAIFNQSQHNSNGLVTPRSVAAAGFRLVLKTGNHNHPGHSTLYVYERVIQEGDYNEIK